MPRSTTNDLQFPLGGVFRSSGYQQQPPYTAYDALNVRPRDTFERRIRGGSRPGLVKTASNQISGASNPIRMLEVLRTSQAGQQVVFLDEFTSSLHANWTDQWQSSLLVPIGHLQVVSGRAVSLGDATHHSQGSLLATVNYNTNASFGVEAALYLEGASENTFFATSTSIADSSWHFGLGMSAGSGVAGQNGIKLSIIGGQGTPFRWEVRTINANLFLTGDEIPTTILGNVVRVLINGELLYLFLGDRDNLIATVNVFSSTTMLGKRCGLAATCPFSSSLDAGFEYFRFSYEPTGATTIATEAMIAVANGELWRETVTGTMASLGGTVSLASDRQLMGANRLGKLYIADNSADKAEGTNGVISGTSFDSASYTDWSTLSIDKEEDLIEISAASSGSPTTGTYKIDTIAAGSLTLTSAPGDATGVTFRIGRGPKVYNSATDALALWTPTSGKIPFGNTIICRYRDRLVLAGDPDNPTVWYMSGLSDPDDWTFVSTDSASAVAATNAVDAGQLGFPISALAPIGDDFLIVAAKSELALLRGDPLDGGRFNVVSRTIGVIDRFAWTLTPESVFVFLSRAGLYQYIPGNLPQPISTQIPLELREIDTTLYEVILRYDVKDEGIHIFVTPRTAGATRHWWLDWQTKTLWPMGYQSSHEPLSCTYHANRNRVVLGCRDGYIRQFEDYADDDSTDIFSSITAGPIALGSNTQDGAIHSMDFILDKQSDDVSWSVSVGNTAEESTTNTATTSGTLSAGINPTKYIKRRGRAFTFTLSSTGRWAWEGGAMRRLMLGRRRV